MKKDGLGEIADKLFDDFRKEFRCELDVAGSIGKRYRRQDEIGTPFCVTVDYDTKENGTVTVRDRDSMNQVRINMDQLKTHIRDQIYKD